MKLVEILARELMEWPEHHGTNAISQDRCGLLNRLDRGCNPKEAAQVPAGSGTWPSLNWTRFSDLELSKTADDWKTAIITREMWEVERARIKGEKAMPKPNKDGWIRHLGGKCPVETGTMVDYRMRDGEIMTQHAGNLEWDHCNECGDIMAWRPHKPVEQRIIEAEQSALAAKANEEAEMPAAKYFDGPIQWRDLIREIDAEQKAADEAYKEATEHRAAQRTSLVAKLKAEGFILASEWSTLEPSEIQVETRRVEDIAQQDMSDWRNWQKGDKCEVTDSLPTDPFCLGELIELLESGDDAPFCKGSGNDRWAMAAHQLKWHSRPTT